MKKAENNDVALAAKKNKASKLKVLVFEPEGGSPYTVEVAPDGDTFEIPGKPLTYKISRGSVWTEAGVSRTVVNAANPQTISVHSLTGNDVFHPKIYNADINNNLAEQVARIARTKPVWARGTTWGIVGMGLLMGLLMFWLIKTVGGGMEGLQDAIANMKLVVQQSSSGPAGNSSTHQPIAPGSSA